MKIMIWTVLTVVCLPTLAFAQNSSLFHRPIGQLVRMDSPIGSQPETLPGPNRQSSRSDPAATDPMSNGGNPVSSPGLPFSAESIPNAPGSKSPFGPIDPMSSGTVSSPNLVGLQASWTYVPPTSARALKLHDIVSIRVEESSTALAQGNATSRKTTSYDATLKDWIRLVGLDTIKPAPQSNGDPRVQTNQSEVYRGDSNYRTAESLTTNIAAEIVDIKPNGLIVLNATRKITQNDNSFQMALTGTCRSQDILPDNTILSRNLVNLSIDKQDQGHLRDGYSRGWLTKLMARVKPF
jgi:flagellar L-ring protein FlgH